MTIYILGNPLVKDDGLAVRLAPRIRDMFPHYNISHVDPTENFIPEDGSVMIDTVQGISKVTIFDSLDVFAGHTMVSPHDYDLFFHLQLLLKLKKIRTITIIGIPPGYNADTAFTELLTFLTPTGS